ncbi:SGNH/GDSL hydrolase family protein [Balneolaceae bacterium ANBcel3]|nr:SGNH/GDSL hydrolase family protein [Balneolaceae bacterium ANBcel3]
MKESDKAALLSYLIQFSDIEKVFSYLPGSENPETIADFFGVDTDDFKTIQKQFEEVAEKAAQEILKDQVIVSALKELPFAPDDTIAVLGDSLSNDRQGWFKILKKVLDLSVPKANFTFIDGSYSGALSAEALRKMEKNILAQKPDWIFVALGSQDAMRLPLITGRTLVSLAEFWENINAIESAILKNLKHPPVWITPPPAITEMMETMPLLDGVVSEEDLREFREIIAGKSGYIVDPGGKRLGDPPAAWNYMQDGFHLSLAGNMETVKSLIKTLAITEQAPSDESGSGLE